MSAATEHDRDDVHERDESVAKDAFSSIPEIQGYLHALGDYKKFTVMLFRTYPTKLSDGTKCSGRLRTVESPDDLDNDSIQTDFGGGDFYIGIYEVGKKGVKKRYAFQLPGTAKLPAHMLDAKRAEAGVGSNGGAGSPGTDSGLGQRAFNTLEKEGERHSRERELRDAEIRQLANDKAKAEAEAMMLKMRLAELEAKPVLQAQQRSAEIVAAENMQTKALAVLEAGTRAQTAAAEARAAAAYEQMKEIRDRAEANANNAAEPFKQMIQMMSDRHSQDVTAMNQQFQNMMVMQTTAHNQQMEIYRAELKAKDERSDRKSSMKEMTETIEQVQKIMEGFGANKEQSMADKLIEKVPPEAFSAVLAVLASALGGGALPAVPPPPALPAAPQAPQAPAGPSPEQQRKVIELVSNMKTLLQQKNPAVDTATYLNMSLGKDSTKLLLQSPVEELIQFLQSADPVFGGPDGEQWIRSVYSELRKTFK